MGKIRSYDTTSFVEKIALEKSEKLFRYSPTEKINVLELADFQTLGKITALRFVEWLQHNPEGVISLPTGKTPCSFIKWTSYFLNTWKEKKTKKELVLWGLDSERKPDLSSFYFVQLDEFYPMNPEHKNSFAYFINKFYIQEFGLDSQKALLMDTWDIGASEDKNFGNVFPDGRVDLSLRFKTPKNKYEQSQLDAITAMDQFAMEFEQKIKRLGGIGFFLGGIGPDGHIAFNVRGSDHLSTTRLTEINYETAAAAAGSLGGIDLARNKAVITLGLNTIVRNPTCTAIIIAAGDSKAQVVRDAVQQPASVLYPATVLHQLQAGCFYVTKCAASLLSERRYHTIKMTDPIPQEKSQQVLIDLAIKKNKSLRNITIQDLEEDHLGSLLTDKKIDLDQLAVQTETGLKEKITNGPKEREGRRFLHTAPHHDDIMLGYLPYIMDIAQNKESIHYFATATSGFNAVSNDYILKEIKNLEYHIEQKKFDVLVDYGCYTSSRSKKLHNGTNGYNKDIYYYLEAVAEKNKEKQALIQASRSLRNLVELFQIDLKKRNQLEFVQNKIEDLKKYFSERCPGQKDEPQVQKLKGMIREWEEELLWGYFGFENNNIFHLRLGFYSGNSNSKQQQWENDIKPVLDLLEKIDPDIVTVALDPEGCGPDTHFKVLRIVSHALKEYLKNQPGKEIQVWGYRNVWHKFLPTESNIFVPVSISSMAALNSAFHTCFGTQREASFPSAAYDGPFCDLAQKIMVGQYHILKTCLGEDFFYKSSLTRLRATRGFCFLKSMTSKEFFEETGV